MLAEQLRKMSAQELRDELAKQREALFTTRFQHATAQLENTAKLPQIKRTVARILTVLKEKGE